MTAYQSIFRKRSRPVTSTDFQEAARVEIFSEYFRSDDVEHDVDKWNQRISFLPQDIQSIFKENFGDTSKLQIVFDGRNEPESVRFFVTDPLGQRCATAIFYDDLEQNPETQIQIEESFKGQSIGKKWFRFLNELCLTFGHDRREFTAGSTNGGYTWARAGAYIDLSPTKHKALTQLREKILFRVEAIKPFIPHEIYHQARALGRVVAKDDLARLAKIDFCFSDKICHDMESWNGSFLDSLSAVFGRSDIAIQACEHGRATQAVIAARAQGVPLNIGRYLLSGTCWDAHVDFNDVQQMERIGDYVGGWKTIRPIDKKTPVFTPAFTHS